MSLTPDQVLVHYKAECLKLSILQLQQEGTIKFFSAACMQADGITADIHRNDLHTILDSILDCEANKTTLMAQLSK